MSTDKRMAISSAILGLAALAISVSILVLRELGMESSASFMITPYCTITIPAILIGYDGIRNKGDKYTITESRTCEISLCAVIVSMISAMMAYAF